MPESETTGALTRKATDLVFAAHLKRIAVFLLLSGVFLALFASFNDIVLFLDGAHFVAGFIQRGGFVIVEPTAATVEILQQFPLYLLWWSGVRDVSAFICLSGFSNLMLPLILTASCYWVLPPGKKAYFVFPLVHYLAGAMASWAPTVTDAPPAAAYFWLLFYLILFHPAGKRLVLLLYVLSLPALYLHEAMSFLSPVLVAASLYRLTRTSDARYRATWVLLSLWFTYVAYAALMAIIDPRSPDNREGFVSVLLDLLWINWDGLNVVVVTSALAFTLAAAIILDNLTNQRRPILRFVSRSSTFVMGAAVLLVAGYLLFGSGKYGFFTQFAARGQAVLISFPMSLFVLLSVIFPNAENVWKDRRILTLVSWLGAAALGWHLLGLAVWVPYISDFRYILENGKGYMPFEDAVGTLSKEPQKRFRRLSAVGFPDRDQLFHAWTLPTISILLSPGGRVSTMVGNAHRHPNSWQPFNPCDFEKKPDGPFNYDAYLQAINEQGCLEELILYYRFSEQYHGGYSISLGSGWFEPEDWGVWSKGKKAILKLEVDQGERALKVALGVTAFVPIEAPELTVDVTLDGVPMDTWVFRAGETQPIERVLVIQPDLLKNKNEASLEFLIENPRSPNSLGLGSDTREIGIGLMGVLEERL